MLSLLSTEQCVPLLAPQVNPSSRLTPSLARAPRSPSVLVPLLTPSLRMQGLHQGRWSLSTVGTAEGSPDQALIGVTDLGEPADDGGADQAAGAAEPGAVPVHPREARRRAAARAKGRKYEFEMVLGLGSTSRGRSVRLPPLSSRSPLPVPCMRPVADAPSSLVPPPSTRQLEQARPARLLFDQQADGRAAADQARQPGPVLLLAVRPPTPAPPPLLPSPLPLSFAARAERS